MRIGLGVMMPETTISYPAPDGRRVRRVIRQPGAVVMADAGDDDLVAMRGVVAGAIDTLRRLPDSNLRPNQLRSAWPEIAGSLGRRRGAIPSAREVDLLDALLPLLHQLAPEQRVAVVGVAAGRSLRDLADELGISHPTVRAREVSGLRRLLRMI